MSDDALLQRVVDVDVFAEIEPNQKERIILALRKAGNVVGYMGDGINDASALHAADVGISVESAVDVAKEAADIVLLEKDLGVLVQGVREGRTTFANTLKYVFMATSANFGNMFSMAGVSLFLPFLPLLPKQILLTNLLTDFPEMTIATDRVDDEMVDYPRRWDIKAIRKFMMTFGMVSSVFDYLTFGALLFLLHATPEQFRTGWFLESVISASLIVLVIRSRKPFFKSRPSTYLFMRNAVHCGRDADCTLHPTWEDFWIEPAANGVSSAHRNNCDALHYHRGNGEDGFLQEGEILKFTALVASVAITLLALAIFQIPPDFVVKFQLVDIAELILWQVMQPSVLYEQEIKG